MYRLTCKISITGEKQTLIIRNICNISITETWRSLTNNCTIVVPRKVKWKNEIIHIGNSGLIREGDRIVIELGYNDNLYEEFTGYVKNVGAGFPVVIECEDDTYLLKKHRVKAKQFETSTLEEIVKYCLPEGFQYKCSDIKLGKFIIRNEVTASKVLNELSKQYNLSVFFRQGILYAGLPYFTDYQKTHTLKFGLNIIQDQLKFVKEEDLQLQIKAVSIMADNTKYEVSVGDESGELRTFYFYNIDDKVKLEDFARKQLNELKYTGLQGTITSFGLPVINQGDVAKIIDELEEIKEREGEYLVEKVTKTFGFNEGFRREIDLGRKLTMEKSA